MVKNPTLEVIGVTYKYISKEDVERVISKIVSKRDRALFSLMYFYGLRCAEAVALNMEDLRLRDNRLYIHAAKSGTSGEVVLTPKTKRYLSAYLKERAQQNGDCEAIFV